MKNTYSKKARLRLNFTKKCSILLVLCMATLCFVSFTGFTAQAPSTRVVRVGFFDFEGYHETDAQNKRGGYGYEYLHEMAKYTGWVFEYVGGTWEECQEMLKNGEIDLLTSAQYSEERNKVFDFASTSMGTSYAQLTVNATNTDFGRNDYVNFNGIRVGLLNGNSRNDCLAEFAAEKQFTYIPTMYGTQEELYNGLKSNEVDAVLTSSLRKLENEAIIAQFSPSPFYAIVKKGNDALLQELNSALEAIEMNNPAFQYNLYQEYYHEDASNTFVLSREEKEYLATSPSIKAVIRPAVSPISYWEDNQFKGISADVMKYLLTDLNINVEYLYADSLAESYNMLLDGRADLACLFESDYNLAEQYHVRVTAPYLKTNYSMIFRQQSNSTTPETQTIAVVDGGLVGVAYVQANYPNARQFAAKSTGAAIDAVAHGDADFALVNVYSAEKALATYPNLTARFIDNEEQQFSIGVSQLVDARLFSILDKRINTMSNQVFNDILSHHTMFQQSPMSLLAYFRQHPVAFILLSLITFAIIIGILLYIIISNKRHAKKIYSLAYTDKLTNLWNLNGFILQGDGVLAQNSKDLFAVASIDLSNFSGINEDYGRHIGDRVIIGMGQTLAGFSTDKTIVAHSDADHFLVLLSYTQQSELHTRLCEICSKLTPCKIDDLLLKFYVNIGVGYIEETDDALLQAIDHAGIARNECSPESPIIYMDKALQGSLLREKEIRDHALSALSQGEFEVYYQPKVDMSTRKIIGAEALIRWNHSKLGFLSPAEFLPIVEDSGHVTEIDFFVLDQACRLIRKWIDAGQEPVVISVNQSRIHFLKSNYLERLKSVISQYNIPPNHIELEITETLFGQEAISNEIIKQIKALGLLISIDDFGSGYSSLHLLHQISVDILKIDKGLLDESGRQEKMRNIIHRVVQIATDLDVEVICEGVETEEQMEFLLGINCKLAQGFLFSKPLPQPAFELLVQKGVIAT